MILLLIAMASAAVDSPSVSSIAQPTAAPSAASPAISDDGFKVGFDTYETVTAKLGKPNSTDHMSDGSITIKYVSVKTKVKGASFIPIVGLFAGGAKGKSTTKTFTFDASGHLQSFGNSAFETDCKIVGGCH